MAVLRSLEQSGIPWQLEMTSALDRYLKHPRGPNVYVAVEAELIDLAKIIDGLSFPGLDRWDAVAQDEDATVYFECVDDPWLYNRSAFDL